MNSVATLGLVVPVQISEMNASVTLATDFISDIRPGTTYLNVITQFISDNRTGTTYPNVATELISDIRPGH
jgi:hypothetical protein